MKIKKNPDKELSKYSLIFFQIGLIIALSFSLLMIERKTVYKKDTDTGVVNYDVLEKEPVPITEMKSIPPPPPPPPPAPIPESIKIVEDDANIEEVNIQSTETDQEERIDVDAFSNTGDVVGVGEVGDVEEDIEDIPFSVIENVPVYPGCENLKNNDERKQCMSQKVNTFMHENFDMSIATDLDLSGIYKVFVSFKIDHTGSIVDVAARAPHPKLQSEGIRVVKMLPKMKPGEQRGRPVGVLYALPITIEMRN